MRALFSDTLNPHFDAGMQAHSRGDARLAMEHLHECLAMSPDRWDVLQHMAAVQSDIVGNLEEAARLLRCASRLRRRLHTPPDGTPAYCFLQAPWATDTASIASMERLIKREILQGHDPKRIVLYAPEYHGHALLDKMAAFITVVADHARLPLPLEAMLSVLEDYSLSESLDGLHKHAWHASADIIRAWESAERGPLLSFSQQEVDAGSAYLRKLGLPDGAWFACVHPGTEDWAAYAPALESIARRGGRVVRLGLDHTPRADAGHSLDIFLLGACRFFIGTQSDHALVPPLFGRPCVLTNSWPAGRRPLNSKDIYLPKLYNAGLPRRLLTFGESMAPPLGHAVRYEHARALDLSAVANTAEEICEAVEEMLDRFDGTVVYSERDELLQSAFDAVAETNLCHGRARAGRGFLRRHSSLLLNVSNF